MHFFFWLSLFYTCTLYTPCLINVYAPPFSSQHVHWWLQFRRNLNQKINLPNTPSHIWGSYPAPLCLCHHVSACASHYTRARRVSCPGAVDRTRVRRALRHERTCSDPSTWGVRAALSPQRNGRAVNRAHFRCGMRHERTHRDPRALRATTSSSPKHRDRVATRESARVGGEKPASTFEPHWWDVSAMLLAMGGQEASGGRGKIKVTQSRKV